MNDEIGEMCSQRGDAEAKAMIIAHELAEDSPMYSPRAGPALPEVPLSPIATRRLGDDFCEAFMRERDFQQQRFDLGVGSLGRTEPRFVCTCPPVGWVMGRDWTVHGTSTSPNGAEFRSSVR